MGGIDTAKSGTESRSAITYAIKSPSYETLFKCFGGTLLQDKTGNAIGWAAPGEKITPNNSNTITLVFKVK